jgi:hypothetical protein
MSILSAVSSSATATGIRAVISGVEKVGKTTFAVSAPRTLLVPLEAGYAGVVVQKTPMLEAYAHIIMLLDEITASCAAGQFGYKTIVFDSATALERLIHTSVLQSDPGYAAGAAGNKKAMTMESALGGYGRAYQYANELMDVFLKRCDILAERYAINIVLTCHVFAAKIVDPTVGEYDSWDLLLHSPKNQKTYGKRETVTQWADLVAFIHEPMFIVEASGGSKMSKGISANKGRVMAVMRTPSYVAGNRFRLTADIPLPVPAPNVHGWNNLAHAIYQSCGVDFFNRD